MDIMETARATRSALAARNMTFNDMTHAQQSRYCDSMRVNIVELNKALARLGKPASKPASKPGNVGKRGQPVSVRSTTGHVERRSEPEWLVEMLTDPRAAVWSQVLVLEDKLGLKTTGTRCQRYTRVENRLAKLRKRGLKGNGDKITDRDWDLMRRYQRRLKAASDAYDRRQRETAEALTSLSRQAAAVQHAARMGARS